MNSKQRRDCKRLSLKTQSYELAIALLLSLSPPLHALVQLGSIQVKEVNFFSKKDLIEKGVDVTDLLFQTFMTSVFLGTSGLRPGCVIFVSYSLPESAYRKKQGSASCNSYLIPY